MSRLVDQPLRVLIRDGRIDRRNVRRCGLTEADLDGILRQHGKTHPSRVHLAVFESKGRVSFLDDAEENEAHDVTADA